MEVKNIETEKWVTIRGFENYKVSNRGRVLATSYLNKANKREKERILKPSKNQDGYLQVSLTNDKGKKSIRVHRLVALSFINNPEDKDTVNHIDGNKLNNNVCNLEWNNRSEQMLHAYSIGLKNYSENTRRQLVDKIGKKVKCVNKLTGEVSFHLSARDCSRYVGKSDRWCDKIISSQDGHTFNYFLSYKDIKDRKGKFLNGSFIKEADLK